MSGWRFVATATVGVAGMVAIILGFEGTDDPALTRALRATATTSLALFLLAIAASPLNSLVRSPATRWLVRNRRSIGLAFAASHFIHLGLIGARATGHTDAFWATRTVTSIIPGFTAYLFIAAMTITSFKGPTRALGRRNWKILHTTGIYIIAAVFAGAHATAGNYILLALLLATLALRPAAHVARSGRS